METKFTTEDFNREFYIAGYKPAGSHVHSSEADMIIEDLLNSQCGVNKCCPSAEQLSKGGMPYSVEYLADNLPAVQYVAQFYLELIIHGGILAKDKSNQEKLDEWMARKNVLGQTNGNVVRQALLSSIIYGYSGLRRIGNDVVYVGPMHFKILKLPVFMNGKAIPGIMAPYFYEVFQTRIVLVEKEKADEYPEQTEAELKKDLGLKKGPDGSYYIGENPASVESVYIMAENFCHLRHSDEGDYGISPLSKDRLRTTLIVDYIRNVIDEVSNDGSDYMIYLQRRSSVGSSLASMISATAANETITAALDSKEKANASASMMAAARILAAKMKKSQKTRINIVNTNSVEKVDKLPGTVELNQYLSILSDAKGTVADIYGIAAMLAGSSGGGWSTGMSSLIPFTIERTIKPFQQRYAEQLAPMIRACAGIKGDIHFKELDWEDQKTEAEIRKLEAETTKNLEQANLYKAQVAQAKKEAQLLTKTSTSTTSTTSSTKTTSSK